MLLILVTMHLNRPLCADCWLGFDGFSGSSYQSPLAELSRLLPNIRFEVTVSPGHTGTPVLQIPKTKPPMQTGSLTQILERFAFTHRRRGPFVFQGGAIQ